MLNGSTWLIIPKFLAVATLGWPLSQKLELKDHCIIFQLTKNMRLNSSASGTNYDKLVWFSRWLLDVGDGKLGDSHDRTEEIEIPEKCPLAQNSGADSLEKSQPVVTSSHAPKNQSYCQAQSKPLVSVPGINSDEEFGSWMIAKRITKKRTHNIDPERKLGKMPEGNKSIGKGKKSASGSRFDVLHEVEDRTFSKGDDHLRKTEVAKTTWRRKEGEALPSIKEGVIEPKKRLESTESGSKEDVVGHIENEQLNLGTNGNCAFVTVEPHLEPSMEKEMKEKVTKVKEKEGKAIKIVEPRLEPSMEIERKEKVTEVKEKEGKATDAPVGKPISLSQATNDYNLRPNGQSSLRNKKKAARAHNVIFGSSKTFESSKASEMKAQAGGKKKNYEEKEILEIVPCNPGIIDSSMILPRNSKNEDVNRGEEVSEVVPASLPLDESIEHCADDVSLVAESQFEELGQEPDTGHAR
ncbi:hypothetical protein K1719_033051 [Acacia pycnantha]|nr:hypothetical protein K1719_033051 [Acacia pycnantha]